MLHDLFRTYKKVLLLVFLLILGLGAWILGHRKPEHSSSDTSRFEKVESNGNRSKYEFETDQFSGTLTLGTNGLLVPNVTLPAVVNFSCKEKAFDGLVRITLPGENGKGIAYQSALNCKAGIHCKQTLEIPQLGNTSNFIFEIVDQFETVIYSRTIALEEMNVEENIVGVGILCKDFSTYNYMENLVAEDTYKSYSTHLVDLSHEFPGDLRQLNALSVIVIDHYATDHLSQIQMETLITWIKNGGQLILGGGKGTRAVLSGMKKSFGIAAGDIEGQEEIIVYDENVQMTGLTVQLSGLEFLKKDLWTPETWISPETVYCRSFGQGHVTAVRFSLSDNGFLHWINREQLTKKLLLDEVIKKKSVEEEEESTKWYLMRALYAFQESQAPATFTYSLYFILYLFCMGMISYYMLKRMKRREYVWFVVPGLSILFMLFTGIRMIGNTAVPHGSFSAISIMDAEKRKAESYLYYQNEDGKKMDISLNPAYDQVEPLDYSYGSSSSQRQLVDYTISNTKNGKEINFTESVPGLFQLMRISKNNQAINNNGNQSNFRVKIQGDYTKFRGTIENKANVDFKRVLLIRGMQYVILDDLKQGDTARIKSSAVRTWANKETEMAIAEEGMDEGILNNLTSYLKQSYILPDNKMNQVIAIGISNEKKSNLLLQSDQMEREILIHVDRFKIKSNINEDCWIGDINRECLSSQDEISDLGMDVLNASETEVTYQFRNPEHILLIKRNADNFHGLIQAYNHKTKKMETILEDTDSQLDQNRIKEYMQEEDGTMRVRYILPEDVESGNAPILSLIYEQPYRE